MSESSLSGRRGSKKRPAERSSSENAGTTGRRVSDKRERILRAAVKVFAKSGFFAARVSEVAKAAGVADGTIYLYFKSKDELLTSLFEDRVEKLLTYMREELPSSTAPLPGFGASSSYSSASSKENAIWPRSSPSSCGNRRSS